MQKSFFIILVLTFTAAFSQDSAEKSVESIEAVGVFNFTTETINYGNVIQNTDGKRTFIFKNVGNAPIVISKVKTSCGCTLASKPTQPVLPGDSAEIQVKYATKKLGAFSKTITISSNASEERKVVRIKGRVVAQN